MKELREFEFYSHFWLLVLYYQKFLFFYQISVHKSAFLPNGNMLKVSFFFDKQMKNYKYLLPSQ